MRAGWSVSLGLGGLRIEDVVREGCVLVEDGVVDVLGIVGTSGRVAGS